MFWDLFIGSYVSYMSMFVAGSERLRTRPFLKALRSGLLCSDGKYAVVDRVLWCAARMPHVN